MSNKTMMPTKVVTGEVRFSYVHIFTPRPAMNPGDGEKYSMSILIPKDDKETISKIKAAMKAAVDAGLPVWGGKKPANLKVPLRDGDEERPDDPAYEGHYFINCSAKTKPGIVDKKRNPITDSQDVYSGCYGRVSVNFYAYNVNGNRGIACGLNNVQKLRDGDHLGGRARAEDDFDDDFSDENDDDFLS